MLVAVAQLSGIYVDVAAKIYAIIGTACAAVPFFQEADLKRKRDVLDNVNPETAEDAALSQPTRDRIEAGLTKFRADFVGWMRAALVFACAAFIVDAIKALQAVPG